MEGLLLGIHWFVLVWLRDLSNRLWIRFFWFHCPYPKRNRLIFWSGICFRKGLWFLQCVYPKPFHVTTTEWSFIYAFIYANWDCLKWSECFVLFDVFPNLKKHLFFKNFKSFKRFVCESRECPNLGLISSLRCLFWDDWYCHFVFPFIEWLFL